MPETRVREPGLSQEDLQAAQEMQLASSLHDEWRMTSQFDPSLPKGQFKPRVKVQLAWGEGDDRRTKWVNDGDELVQLGDGSARVKGGDILTVGEDGKEKWFSRDDVPADVLPVAWFPLETTETFRQDIANTDFEDLHPDWQAENLREGRVIRGVVYNMGITAKWLLKVKRLRNRAGTAVNDAWMAANSWAKGSDLDVGFVNLPPKQQDKDIAHIKLGVETVYPTRSKRAVATIGRLVTAVVG